MFQGRTGRYRADRIRARSCRRRSEFGRNRATFGRTQATAGRPPTKMGQTPISLGPRSTTCWRRRRNLDRVRPVSGGQIWVGFDAHAWQDAERRHAYSAAGPCRSPARHVVRHSAPASCRSDGSHTSTFNSEQPPPRHVDAPKVAAWEARVGLQSAKSGHNYQSRTRFDLPNSDQCCLRLAARCVGIAQEFLT